MTQSLLTGTQIATDEQVSSNPTPSAQRQTLLRTVKEKFLAIYNSTWHAHALPLYCCI